MSLPHTAGPAVIAAAGAVLGAPLDDLTRLYRLQGPAGMPGDAPLLVEAWSLREALSSCWEMDLSALSVRADLDLDAMLGQPVTLHTRLSDGLPGSEAGRTGLVMLAERGACDGGLARYRLLVRPWLSLLAHTFRSQVWAEQSVVEIIEAIFARYAPLGAWHWCGDVAAHLAQSPYNRSSHGDPGGGRRSFVVQYRQSDLSFVARLLAEEGLAWRFEEDPAAPVGHRLVIFADSGQADSCPEDATSTSGVDGPGIRVHHAGSIQAQDAIQVLGQHISPVPSRMVVTSWDHVQCRSLTGVATTDWQQVRGHPLPQVPPVHETWRDLGAYAFATQAQADRAALLLQQVHECRWERWLGRSTVRTFAAGQHFTLAQPMLEQLPPHEPSRQMITAPAHQRSLVLTELTHAGINNLPKDTSEAIARRLGPPVLADWVDQAVRRQAQETGYGNHFHALRRHCPWRPELAQEDRPQRIEGVLTATVVAADGSPIPQPGHEIDTDRLGRVRIAFDFQDEGSGLPQWAAANTSRASTWVRVAQWLTGPGMGAQFTPRVGQEVLVGFLDADVQRPIVLGALYNGQGEGGAPPTPGGQQAAQRGPHAGQAGDIFGRSTDHRPSGQGNRIGSGQGGHSPAWHGAAAGGLGQGGQRNASALSGIKTREFGLTSHGYNQLVFDDSQEGGAEQLRVQLATTQHASQLNLGHLIHQADNHRGSFRGEGFELRTDAYGAIRASRGVVLSTYGLLIAPGHPVSAEPAGDIAGGQALARQLFLLGAALSEAARVHQTVQLASHIGTRAPGQSALDHQHPPLRALHRALGGMVTAQGDHHGGGLGQAVQDALAKGSETAEGRVPHLTDPLVTLVARAGLAVTAGQDLQMAAGEGIAIASGGDTHIATGGAARVHTGQAIGILGGAIEPGHQAAGTGLSLIAAQGDVDLQAHNGPMQIAARQPLSIQSRTQHVDWAAAKRIVLSTAGGASVTIEGGNITVACPGTMTVRAGMKSFVGPHAEPYVMPQMPASVCEHCLLGAMESGSPIAALR